MEWNGCPAKYEWVVGQQSPQLLIYPVTPPLDNSLHHATCLPVRLSYTEVETEGRELLSDKAPQRKQGASNNQKNNKSKQTATAKNTPAGRHLLTSKPGSTATRPAAASGDKAAKGAKQSDKPTTNPGRRMLSGKKGRRASAHTQHLVPQMLAAYQPYRGCQDM